METKKNTYRETLGEKPVLKLGYASMLHERWPINEDPEKCSSRESAYFLQLELENCSIPEHLQYENLEHLIPEKHLNRIKSIWESVLLSRKSLLETADVLKSHWSTVPVSSRGHKEVTQIVRNPPLSLQDEYRRTLRAVIYPTQDSDEKDKPGIDRLKAWQKVERHLRRGLFTDHKTFLVILRLYFEMLLESSPENNEYVIPKETYLGNGEQTVRREIALRNRYLRLIDSTHQSISAAKAAHHQQKKSSLRKFEDKPAAAHSTEITFNAIYDTVPYIIERTRLQLNPVMLGIVGPLHDLVEDTELDMDDVKEFMSRLTDIYDSSIDPYIESGFGTTRTEVKRQVLDLCGRSRTDKVGHCLRILSNNTDLSDREKRMVKTQNPAGTEKTREILKISQKEYSSWHIPKEKKQPESKTFKTFPREHNRQKITGFLTRMLAIASSTRKKKLQQVCLILKMEDRAHNIRTQEEMPVERRLDIARETVTRLLAWGMWDHDNKNYPLFNALPRLIDITLAEYLLIKKKFPTEITDHDTELIKLLQKWQAEVKRYPIPDKN
ncbi:hypothetical protein GF366_05090 [Candidatus Peregrinibacteria bacterium]|nr:hypothetical protein [Candidatus Peregrinibacteria bacterium]